MQVLIKPGVVLKEVNSPFLHMCYAAWFIYREYGLTPTLTSANDSKHMAGSLHYTNHAWDLRIWGLRDVEEVATKLRNLLNAKAHDYDVVVEGDHRHIEYDPKEAKP